jgi:hypothetical protein
VRVPFAVTAALLTAAYLAMRVTDQARYVSVLSGTLPDGAASVEAATTRATAYVALHFAFVLVVPTLLIAALLDFVVQRALDRRRALEK